MSISCIARVGTTGGGTGPSTGGFTDSFKLSVIFSETNAAQTDTQTMSARLSQSDTNAAQTEALKFTFPSNDFKDTSALQTDARSFLVKIWLSGSAGTGTTSPANADGPNNGTVATLQTAVGGASTVTLTSSLGANIPTLPITTAVYKGWFKNVAALATSTAKVTLHSSTGLFTDLIIFTNSAATTIDYTTTPLSVDLIAAGINTLAKLQSIQVLHFTQDVATGVSPTVLTVDAGEIDLNVTF